LLWSLRRDVWADSCAFLIRSRSLLIRITELLDWLLRVGDACKAHVSDGGSAPLKSTH